MPVAAGRHTHLPADLACWPGVDLSFGNFCTIASGLRVVSGQHPPVHHREVLSVWPFREEWGMVEFPESLMDGFVSVGHDVWIGEGVTIVEGASIQTGAIVGAHSVVRGVVPAFHVVVGNPQQVIRPRFSREMAKAIIQLAWWDWDDETIRARENLMAGKVPLEEWGQYQ